MRRILPVVLLLLVVAGCTTFSGRGSPFDDSDARDDSVRILVDNRNFNDGRLIAVVDGRRRPLGTAAGLTQSAFEVPFETGTRLSVDIDLVGGGSYQTRSVAVAPGTTVDLIIASEVTRSFLQPRGRGD